MLLRGVVPSWFDIENRITHAMGYQGGATYRIYANERVDSIGLKIRRVSSVRTAFIHAEWEAGRVLRQRYADLDISSVLNDLMDAVSQMAMIVAGSVLTGATLGAGFGAFFGGVGAVPSDVAGAAMGLQVSTWILGVLGLESIAEFFVDGLPKIAEHYVRGIKAAWNGPRGEPGLSPFIQDDPYAQQSATHHIALGHIEVVTLLLGAMVAYLTRGRGNATVLAQEMRGSPKGARLGQWMLEHEDKLKKRPDLQASEPRKGSLADQEVPQAHKPEAKSAEVQKKQTSKAPNISTNTIDFEGHVLNAEVKPGGKVVGGHSIASGEVRVIPGTASAPNAQGVYRAKIQVADPANLGKFLSKTNNGGISTMFPDSWSADRIKSEVNSAFQDRIVSGNRWSGITPSGVKVEGYLEPKTTVYPKF
ncbi:EndoU domain-containing protein [Pseudomonas alliivorans]|nr:EndoU domain-containing protein [Pseudomonas alliivorans]MEE4709495.1 EndoU domain-containing protein [Pseudomonas alliivorans]MEE4726247.1 EndoU domain-containing protein [Pseudomonas alliivorans]MEE4767321.1 EndoU domain-containing protein [Pseudomonas alliivorans]